MQVGRAIVNGVALPYRVVNGRAIFEGDIELAAEPLSAFQSNLQARWPNATIPYVIDAAIPDQKRIQDAIDAWASATPIRLAPRGSETNYVHFMRQQSNGVCFSSIGMIGGEQFLRVDDACTANGLAHEIGHSIGLYHENSRQDRDFYLTVNPANADRSRYGDLAVKGPPSADGGPFDYGSIMEYSRFEPALDRQLVVIETIPAGMAIDGSAHGLSAGDIDRVSRMYGVTPSATTITTNPAGLQITVDEQIYTTPKAFDWAPGSRHTVDVPDKQGDGLPLRYLFGRWSDNLDKSHTITASADCTVWSASFIRQYLVKTGVNAAGGGSITVTPPSADGYYAEGSQVSIVAAPAAGFAFQAWSGFVFTTLEGWGQPSTSFRVTIPNLNYTASFTRNQTFTITTDPPNLPLTINGTRGSAPRNLAVSPGGTLTVAADAVISFGTATTRYVFDSWSDGGAEAHTITAPASGAFPTLTAKFKVQHAVQTAFSGRGAISVSPSSSDGYYDHGATVRIAAAPAVGYQLLNWKGSLSGGTAAQEVTVNGQIYAQASFLQPFTLSSANIVNSANFQFGSVSPGEIVTIFGMSLGPNDLAYLSVDGAGKLTTSAGGVRVLFDGVPAPIVYAAQNQIAPIVPYAVAGKTVTAVQVEFNGTRTPAVGMAVAAAAPALFTLNGSGMGQAAALNQDGSINSSANPAAKGSVVVLFATGEGQTSPVGVDGRLATGTTLPAPVGPVTVLVGGPPGVGKEASLLYAGAAPTLVAGVMQIDIFVPADAPSGNVPVYFSVGGVNGGELTTIAVK